MPVDTPTEASLSRGERVSWWLQGLIRRWIWLIIVTVGTAGIFVYTAVEVGASLGAGTASLLTWWNLGASWAALMVEGTVGIAMFSMAKRTARVLRQVRDAVDRLDHIIEHHPDIPSYPTAGPLEISE